MKEPCVGMHTQEVAIGENLKVGLSSDAKDLDEILVVAYGTAKKSEYTGSASVVKADQIEDALVSSVTSVLSGKVAGVQTLSSDGRPGSAPTLRIRGTGSMRNSGVELELNYNIINTKNIDWSINANITSVGNKIIKLPEELVKDGKWVSGSYIYKEGESRYQMYIPHYAGVNPENGMAMYTAKFNDEYYAAHPELAAAGIGQEFNTGVDYRDANGNIIIAASGDGKVIPVYTWDDVYNGRTTSDGEKILDVNRKESGSLLPKAYGGFGTNLTAYGIDFSMTFAYQFGGKVYDSTYQALMHAATTSYNGRNYHSDIMNRWTTPGQVTDVPRINAGDQYTSYTSDRWFISSNFLSLNNITLGYTLPAKWTRKIGLESVRIYGAAENVALWSKRRGLDPRQGYATSNSSTYSPIRSISGGIRVQF